MRRTPWLREKLPPTRQWPSNLLLTTPFRSQVPHRPACGWSKKNNLKTASIRFRQRFSSDQKNYSLDINWERTFFTNRRREIIITEVRYPDLGTPRLFTYGMLTWLFVNSWCQFYNYRCSVPKDREFWDQYSTHHGAPSVIRLLMTFERD